MNKTVFLTVLHFLLAWVCFRDKVHSELLLHLENTEAVVGQERIVLKCQTDIINTANPVEWHHEVNKDAAFEIVYKRGMILNRYRGRLLVFSNATTGQYDLVITGVKLHDAGAYTCIDRDSQSRAELIVFEKYPANDFCMINSPSDGFLGSNDCGLESDTVRMSCDLSYRGNVSPVLEWMVGETVIVSTITNNADGVTRSSIEQKADQLQTSTYMCRIKYLHSTIASNLTWSTTVNITAIKTTKNMSYVGCDQESEDCPGVHNRACNYSWLCENGTELTSSSTIKLTNKPDGHYTCLATCSVRQMPCSYVAKRFNYRCNQLKNGPRNLRVIPAGDVFYPDDNLTCMADGNPKPEVLWLNLETKAVTRGPTVTIKEEMIRDQPYQFLCRATNPATNQIQEVPAGFSVKQRRISKDSTILKILLAVTLTVSAVIIACLIVYIAITKRKGRGNTRKVPIAEGIACNVINTSRNNRSLPLPTVKHHPFDNTDYPSPRPLSSVDYDEIIYAPGVTANNAVYLELAPEPSDQPVSVPFAFSRSVDYDEIPDAPGVTANNAVYLELASEPSGQPVSVPFEFSRPVYEYLIASDPEVAAKPKVYEALKPREK